MTLGLAAGGQDDPGALSGAAGAWPSTGTALDPRSGLWLVVDLDGTLLRSDMLHETFWSVAAHDLRGLLAALAALGQGRAALKRALARRCNLDVASLPYDPEVIARARDWRAAGGRVALVTATDQTLAEAIAAHLGLFDEVHGSDGALNLKGAGKARVLTGRYGARGFVYMGDSAADLAVWPEAAGAITVNAPAAVRRGVDRLGLDRLHLRTQARGPRPYLRAMRPHQWLKNLLVFVPMVTAHALGPGDLATGLLAFLAFSLVASGVYATNDLLDLEADRAHPRKRARPFAAGAVPIAHATAMAFGLLGGGLLTALAAGRGFVLVILVYLVTTMAYSLDLKRRAVIDICVLACLYTLRIVAGAVAVGIGLSFWLLAFSMFLFFSLASVKRQAELLDSARRGLLGAKGRGYRTDDLPVIATASLTSGYVSVLVMALYVSSPEVVRLYSTPTALWGICAVLLYWITRVALITHRGQMHDDPVVFAARDRISQVCLLLTLGFALAGAVL